MEIDEMRMTCMDHSEAEARDMQLLYRHRITADTLSNRRDVWNVLCQRWFARYIPPNARVLEVAAGYCDFINNIEASERVAVDVNPETLEHAAPGVIVHNVEAELVAQILPHAHFDVVFMSNFLEHCKSRESVLSVLKASEKVLRRGGSLLILGPNFRYCYKKYFDYFDHRLPLTDKSVVEAIQLAGLEIESVSPRTLPFTFKGRLPSWPWMVRWYLRLPILWRVFGAQFFIIAKRPLR